MSETEKAIPANEMKAAEAAVSDAAKNAKPGNPGRAQVAPKTPAKRGKKGGFDESKPFGQVFGKKGVSFLQDGKEYDGKGNPVEI